jgi:hypothetical protein
MGLLTDWMDGLTDRLDGWAYCGVMVKRELDKKRHRHHDEVDLVPERTLSSGYHQPFPIGNGQETGVNSTFVLCKSDQMVRSEHI